VRIFSFLYILVRVLISNGPRVSVVNLGKWILRNLFQGFIREEEQAHSRRIRTAMSSTRTTGNLPSATPQPPPLPHSPQESPAAAAAAMSASANATGASNVVVVARNMLPALAPPPVGLGISHVSPSQTQLSSNTVVSPTTTVPSLSGGDSTPQAPQPAQGGTSGSASQPHQRAQAEALTTAPAATTSVAQKDDSAAPTRRPSVSSGGAGATPALAPASTTPDESGSGTSATSGNGLATPGTPGGGIIGKLRGFGRTSKRAQNENAPVTPAPVARVAGPTATATGQGAGPSSSTVSAAAAAATTTTTTSTSAVPSSTQVRPVLSPLASLGSNDV
jgi:WD repeat-containing protein 48